MKPDTTDVLVLSDAPGAVAAEAAKIAGVSRVLNTSESTVEKWETGAKRPSGMALKLLAIVQKHGLQVLS